MAIPMQKLMSSQVHVQYGINIQHIHEYATQHLQWV